MGKDRTTTFHLAGEGANLSQVAKQAVRDFALVEAALDRVNAKAAQTQNVLQSTRAGIAGTSDKPGKASPRYAGQRSKLQYLTDIDTKNKLMSDIADKSMGEWVKSEERRLINLDKALSNNLTKEQQITAAYGQRRKQMAAERRKQIDQTWGMFREPKRMASGGLSGQTGDEIRGWENDQKAILARRDRQYNQRQRERKGGANYRQDIRDMYYVGQEKNEKLARSVGASSYVELAAGAKKWGMSIDDFVRKKKGALTIEQRNEQQLRRLNAEQARTAKGTGQMSTAWTRATRVVQSLVTAYVGFQMLRGGQNIVRDAVEFMSTMEQVKLGIAEVMLVQQRVYDRATGAMLPMKDQLALGFEIADETIKTLINDSVRLGLPLEEVLKTFTKIGGVSTKAGVSLQDTLQIMESLTVLAQRTGIPFRQLTKSVDNLFTGLRVSQTELGVILGLSKSIVDEQRKQGTLAQFFQDRVEAVTADLSKHAQTLEGIKNSLNSASNAVFASVGAGAYEVFKGALASLRDYFDALRSNPERMAKLRNEVTAFANSIRDGFNTALQFARKFGDYLKVLAGAIAGYKMFGPLGGVVGGVAAASGAGPMQTLALSAPLLASGVLSRVGGGGGISYGAMFASGPGGVFSALGAGLTALISPVTLLTGALGGLLAVVLWWLKQSGDKNFEAAERNKKTRAITSIGTFERARGQIDYLSEQQQTPEIRRKMRHMYASMQSGVTQARDVLPPDSQLVKDMEKDAAKARHKLFKFGALDVSEISKEFGDTIKKITAKEKKHLAILDQQNAESKARSESSIAVVEAEQSLVRSIQARVELESKLIGARLGLAEAQSRLSWARVGAANVIALQSRDAVVGKRLAALGSQASLAEARGASHDTMRGFAAQEYALKTEQVDVRRKIQEEIVKQAKAELDIANKKVAAEEDQEEVMKRRLNLEEKLLDLAIRQQRMKVVIAEAEARGAGQVGSLIEGMSKQIYDKARKNLETVYEQKGMAGILAPGELEKYPEDVRKAIAYRATQPKAPQRVIDVLFNQGPSAKVPGLAQEAEAIWDQTRSSELNTEKERIQNRVDAIRAQTSATAARAGLEAAQAERGLMPDRRDLAKLEHARNQAVADTGQAEAVNKLTEGQNELNNSSLDYLPIADAMTEANIKLRDSYVNVGATAQEALADLIGGDKITDVTKRAADRSGREFVEGFLKQKLNLDAKVEANFMSRFPAIGKIAGWFTGKAFSQGAGEKIAGAMGGGGTGGAGESDNQMRSLVNQIPSMAQKGQEYASAIKGWFSGGASAPASAGAAGTQSVTNAMWTSPYAAEGTSVAGVGEVAGGAGGGSGAMGAMGGMGGYAALIQAGITGAVNASQVAKQERRKFGATESMIKRKSEQAFAEGFLSVFGIKGGLGRTLGKVMNTTVLSPHGSDLSKMYDPRMMLDPSSFILSLLGTFKPPTSGSQMNKELARMFKELDIPRIAWGRRGVASFPGTSFGQSKLPSLPAGYESLKGFAGGIGTTFKMTTPGAERLNGPLDQNVQNAILNAASALGLAPEDAKVMLRTLAKGLFGGDEQSSFYKIAGAYQAGTGRARGSFKLDKAGFLSQLDTMLNAFHDIAPAIDTARVSMAAFQRDGTISFTALQRAVEDVEKVIGQGIPNALQAAIGSGNVIDAAEALAKTYTDAFNSRIGERLLQAPEVGKALTDSTMLYQQAIDAMMAGDTAKANMYLAQARTAYMGGQQTFMGYANKLAPWAIGYGNSLGVYAGGEGIQNQTGAGMPFLATNSITTVPGSIGSPIMSIVHGGEKVMNPGYESSITDGLGALANAQHALAAAIRSTQTNGKTPIVVKVVVGGDTIQSALNDNVERDGGGRGVRTSNSSVGVVG